MAPLFFPFSSSPPRSSSSPPPPSLSSPATSSSAVMAADLDQPSQNPLHPPSSADDTDPKPLSETENKSLRAARFGTPLNLSEHEKRQTRAERFGTESKDSEEKKRKRRAESVAPMMDWTDNCFRTLARLISKHAWLYREMVVVETIVHQKENLVLGVSIGTTSYCSANWWVQVRKSWESSRTCQDLWLRRDQS